MVRFLAMTRRKTKRKTKAKRKRSVSEQEGDIHRPHRCALGSRRLSLALRFAGAFSLPID